MSSKRWTALIIAFALFVLSIGVQFTGPKERKEHSELPGLFDDLTYKERIIKQGAGKQKIVVLHLEGIIQDIGEAPFISTLAYNHRQFLQMIEHAGKDPLVAGVILHVNTPGGGVVESDEIHDKLVELQETYNTPLYVSMGNTAASGGYYVSAPAEKIVAHPATLTGSIGVIMQNIDISELAEQYGIDFNTIKSGEFKDILSPTRKMTEEEQELLKQMVDDLYDDFVEVIVDGRSMDEKEVRNIGDGRIFTGKQAKDLDLVDDLGTLDDTIAFLQEDYDLANARVVEYEPSVKLSQLFSLSVKSLFREDAELLGVLNVLKHSKGPRLLYLYAN